MPQERNKHEYKVGLLGMGRVIRAFLRHYLENQAKLWADFGFALKFTAIADSRSFLANDEIDIRTVLEEKEKGQPVNRVGKESIESFMPLINQQKIDILIDGLPGSRLDAGLSYPYLLTAVKKGIPIICVNKAPIVFKGDELFQVAKSSGVYIGLSATTGGALPAAGMVNELINAGVYKVRGILNGTSNYVLDKIMFEARTKLEAIQEAVRLGIAEPDYRFDLEGIDTCYKMVIIGLLLTGKCVDLKTIYCRGIMELSEREIISHVRQGKAVRLIGNLIIENNEPTISVNPEYLDISDPLFSIYGANKGITFYTRYMGDLTIMGGASGLEAIAATILKDIINYHRLSAFK